MQIKSIEAIPLRYTLQEPFAYSQKWFQQRTALLVRVDTDEGLSGWGEVYCHDAWPALKALIEQVYAPLLVGREALARSVIWELVYNWTRDYGQKGLTTSALSGIDIALWDLYGKTVGLPIAALLGGLVGAPVPAYATGLYLTHAVEGDPGLLAEEAADYVARGFRAVKLKVGQGLERDLRHVRVVREAIGPEIGLMVDANHALDAAGAIRLGRALAPYDIGWLEEPVAPEDRAGYRAVREALDIPIAGGEAEFTRYGFRDLIDSRGVDIIQPDLCVCGGITEGLKIAALAGAWNVRCIPHVWGTGITLAASLHFISALPQQPPSLNAPPNWLEYDRTENPLRDEMLPLALKDGALRTPTGPGLGVTPDPDWLEHYRCDV